MEFLLQPLTLLTFLPLVGVLVILFINSEQKAAIRWTALVTSLVTLVVSLWVFSMFDKSNPDLQLEAKYAWIHVAGWNIYYYLAVDGLSICWCCSLASSHPSPSSPLGKLLMSV